MNNTTNLFDELFRSNPDIISKKIQYPDDLLALSCQGYLNYLRTGSNRYPELQFLTVSEAARAMAADIRYYYGLKFTEAILRDQSLTDFRRKMAEFLQGKHELTASEMGLVYRLPYFYAEDQDIDWVHENTEAVDANTSIISGECHYELTPLRRSLRSARSGDLVRFWFKTKQAHPAVFTVPASNALLPLMDSIFKKSSISVTAHAKIRSIRGQQRQRRHLDLFNLQLAL